MSKSDSIFSIGLLALAAYVLYSMGLLTKPVATSSASTSACPRGRTYRLSPYAFITGEGCDTGYNVIGVGQCGCQTPSSTPGTEHSPQTPPPKPDVCPWNSSLLAGDIRCQNPSQSTVIIGKAEPGFTECIIGAPKWDGGC